MKAALLVLLGVIATAYSLNCSKCMDLDWGTVNTTLYSLPTSVDGYNNCTSPSTETCAAGYDRCMNGTLTQTISGTENGTSWEFELTYTSKMCMTSNETCSTMHNAIAASDTNNTYTFKSCDISLCTENGAGNCTAMESSAAKTSLFFVVLVSFLALMY